MSGAAVRVWPRALSWVGEVAVIAGIAVFLVYCRTCEDVTSSRYAFILIAACVWAVALALRIRRQILVLTRDGIAFGAGSAPVPWDEVRIGSVEGTGRHAVLGLVVRGEARSISTSTHDLDRLARTLREQGARSVEPQDPEAAALESEQQRRSAAERLLALDPPLRFVEYSNGIGGWVCILLGLFVIVLNFVVPAFSDVVVASPAGFVLGFALVFLFLGVALLLWGNTTMELGPEGITLWNRVRRYGLRWDQVTGVETSGRQPVFVLRAGEAWLMLPTFQFMRGRDRKAASAALKEICDSLGLVVRTGPLRWRQHRSTRLPR